MPIFDSQSSPTQLVSYTDLDLSDPPPTWDPKTTTLMWEADTRLRRLESIMGGQQGPPGPEGPTGPAGPPGISMLYIGQSATTADVTGITAAQGWTPPIVSMTVPGNGSQRYRILIQGNVWRNTTDAPGLAYYSIFKSTNPSTPFITPASDGVSPEQTESFSLEATDVPTSTVTYSLQVDTSSDFLTVTAGSRIMIWQTG